MYHASLCLHSCDLLTLPVFAYTSLPLFFFTPVDSFNDRYMICLVEFAERASYYGVSGLCVCSYLPECTGEMT